MRLVVEAAYFGDAAGVAEDPGGYAFPAKLSLIAERDHALGSGGKGRELVL